VDWLYENRTMIIMLLFALLASFPYWELMRRCRACGRRWTFELTGGRDQKRRWPFRDLEQGRCKYCGKISWGKEFWDLGDGDDCDWD